MCDPRRSALSRGRLRFAELAKFANVVCKVSGLVTEADHARWTPAELEPYVSHVLAVFGEDRVLFRR